MNKHGLYSKAAQIVRGLQQERGTAEQMVAAAKKLGLKDAELQNAGPLPTGKVTREQLAKHFESRLPKMYVSQYGENPSYMPPGSGKRFMDLQVRSFKSDNPLSPEEERELAQMRMRHGAEPSVITEPSDDEDGGDPSDPYYSNYAIPGGKNYRERLLTLGTDKGKPRYNSSHWTDHDNVLAHIRMSDRTVGNKSLLHVEELQSDWGQEGRDKGFADPENPHEIFNTKTGEVISRHPTHEAMWDAFRAIPEDQAAGLDYGKSKAPPKAPYVTNTQHWTDLALKNVLREAALGNYDGVVFTPGQAQADRYGLEKQVSNLQLVRNPSENTFGTLHAWGMDGRKSFSQDITDESHLGSMVGKEIAQKLLSAPKSNAPSGYSPNAYAHNLEGDDLKVGGQGMKGYYDNIVPKSVMALAKQHDPDVKPGEPIDLKSDDGDYQGFHLPMTDKLKNSVLDKGFPAMRRGGAV